MQNIEINIHGFRFIEIETGYVEKPNRTAINRVPLSALHYSQNAILLQMQLDGVDLWRYGRNPNNGI